MGRIFRILVCLIIFHALSGQTRYVLQLPEGSKTARKIRVFPHLQKIVIISKRKKLLIKNFSGENLFQGESPILKDEVLINMFIPNDSLICLIGNRHLFWINLYRKSIIARKYPYDNRVIRKQFIYLPPSQLILMMLPKPESMGSVYSSFSYPTYSYDSLQKYFPLFALNISSQKIKVYQKFGKWFGKEKATGFFKDFFIQLLVDTFVTPRSIYFKFANEDILYRYEWKQNRWELTLKMYMPSFLYPLGTDEKYIYCFWAPRIQEMPAYFNAFLFRGSRTLFVYDKQTLKKVREIKLYVPQNYAFGYFDFNAQKMVYYTYEKKADKLLIELRELSLYGE